MSVNPQFSQLVSSAMCTQFPDLTPEAATPLNLGQRFPDAPSHASLIVPYNNYQGEHNFEGWSARKVTSIPNAVVGLWGFICKLALGVISNLSGRDNGSQNIRCSFDHLAESRGHIVTLFNDRYGSYLVASAQVMIEFHNAQLTPRANDDI